MRAGDIVERFEGNQPVRYRVESVTLGDIRTNLQGQSYTSKRVTLASITKGALLDKITADEDDILGEFAYVEAVKL